MDVEKEVRGRWQGRGRGGATSGHNSSGKVPVVVQEMICSGVKQQALSM